MIGAGAVPRPLHPVAWWLWALGLATAASRTTNPLLLALILAVVTHVVLARRTNAPWSRAFEASILMAGVVLVVRLVFEALFGVVDGATVLVTLPELPLPGWAAGVVVGGAVTVEGLVIGLAQALQIATIIVCVGAANSLASPTRLLKSTPGALYELGVAVVVGLTLVPQAVESVRRLRQAQRLRGRSGRGVKAAVGLARPVLESAFDRSLALAASMDSRGYGRRAHVPAAIRAVTVAATLTGLVGVVCGSYGLLDASAPGWLGLPLLLAGSACAALGFVLAGRRVDRTRHRPDPWRAPEWLTVAAGAVPAAVLVVAGARGEIGLLGPAIPLTWPAFPLLPAAAVLVALLPAYVTPLQQDAPSGRPRARSTRPAPAPAPADPSHSRPDAVPVGGGVR